MTGIQMSYLQYKEDQRSNLARESETMRHNLVTESQNARSLTESERHNRVGETWTGIQTLETIRSNQAREQETHRHNVWNEYTDLYKYQESARHNRVMESQGERNLQQSILESQSRIASNEAQASLNRAKAEQQEYETALYTTNWQNKLDAEKSYYDVYRVFAGTRGFFDAIGLGNTSGILSKAISR